MEPGVARFLARVDAAEERLKCAIYAQHHVLQDLGIDLAVFGHRLFYAGQLGFLVVVGDGDAAHLPGFASLADGGVVDVAAEHQGTLKHPLLLGRGLELVFVGLVDALLFHTQLFCLIGKKPTTIGTIVAPAGSGPSHFHPRSAHA